MRIFPSPFNRRQAVQSIVTLSAGILAVGLANLAGIGGGAAMMLLIMLGTAVCVVWGRENRVYFTALYTITSVVGFFGWSIFHRYLSEGEFPNREDILPFCILTFFFVILPITFAWLISLLWPAARSTDARIKGRLE